MTDEEIYRDWKEAKAPKRQVQIIADMEFKGKKKLAAKFIMEQCEIRGEKAPLYIKAMAGLDISDELKAFVRQGLTKPMIADEFGVSIPTVSAWLKKHGIKMRTERANESESVAQQETPENDIAALEALKNSGKMLDKIKLLPMSPIVKLAEIIAEQAVKYGKGEIFVSADSNGDISSITWRLVGYNEQS